MRKISNDLALGKEGENVIVGLLTKAGYLCDVKKGKHIDYDIHCKLPPTEFTIEVKYDIMASKTGNVAIEYWNSKSNKPSGITATKADLWCHIIGSEKEIWICKSSELKNFIQNAKPEKIIYKGGNLNSDMLLYKKDDFCKNMRRIDNINNVELFRLIEWFTQKQ